MKKTLFFIVTVLIVSFMDAQELKTIRNRNIKEVGQYDTNGKKTGEWKYYNTLMVVNGKLTRVNGQLIFVKEFENGKLNGVEKSYNKDGQITSTTEYVNGLKHGEHKSIYTNGDIETVGQYKNGFAHGIWKENYYNGKLKETGEYSEGFKNGVWKEYNEVQKRYIITKYRAGSRAFHDYVFRETTLDFDTKTNELLIPTTDEPREYCDFREKPDRYVCNGGGGRPSHNFLDKGEKDGDFKVAIFHPVDSRNRDYLFSLTTFVENGKVTQQSRCFSDIQGIGLGTGNKMHFQISRMKCYVVTPELAEVINEVQGLEDAKDEKRYKRFLNVLKSPKYKSQLLEAYQYNWEKTFLNVNRENHFDYYTTINEKRFYNIETHGKSEETKIINFEDSKVAKESKSLYDLLVNANALFKKVYLNPSENLAEWNILAEPKSK